MRLSTSSRGLVGLCVCMCWVCGVLRTLNVEAHAAANDAVITILEPFEGQVLRDTRDVHLSYTIEAVQPWRDLDHPPELVVGITDEAGVYFQIQREPVDALTEGEGPISHGRSVTINSVPNGHFKLTVQIEGDRGGKGRGGAQRHILSAAATFSVDVALDLTLVEEEEDEFQDDSGADIRPRGEQDGGDDASPALSSFTDEDLEAKERCAGLGMLPRRRPARIFDGFTYKDEIDLLEVWLSV
jgi:hypothetical protein